MLTPILLAIEVDALFIDRHDIMNKRRHEQMSAPSIPKKSSRQSLALSNNSASRTPFDAVPNVLPFTSLAPNNAPDTNGGPVTATTLPLNLIALIVSFLDDVGDLARVTRTSRLLYYMTLPQLYRQVHLHSYADIKYVNGKPSGFGGGSPFLAALSGLAIKGHAALVHDFRVYGEWKEVGVEDFAKGVSEQGQQHAQCGARAVSCYGCFLARRGKAMQSRPLRGTIS